MQQKVIPFDIQHHTISKEIDKLSFKGSPKEKDISADDWQSCYSRDEQHDWKLGLPRESHFY